MFNTFEAMISIEACEIDLMRLRWYQSTLNLYGSVFTNPLKVPCILRLLAKVCK